ncbi:hypothetical protein HMPREF9413_1427 [Paenibacillus sp. HGF7]|nr:hypothetical protein HMPREF9413_1427 [Paenibacillus sp. HGF7]
MGKSSMPHSYILKSPRDQGNTLAYKGLGLVYIRGRTGEVPSK